MHTQILRLAIRHRPQEVGRLTGLRPPARRSYVTRPILRHGKPIVLVQQRRSFLNALFQKPKRDMREPLMDPGMDKMLELEKRIHLTARMPSQEQLAIAFNAFIRHKVKKAQGIEDFHATRLLQAFDTMEKQEEEDSELMPFPLTRKDLAHALGAVSFAYGTGTSVHNALARRLWERLAKLDPVPPEKETESFDPDKIRMHETLDYIRALTSTGDAAEAQHVLIDSIDRNPVHRKHATRGWSHVLSGFAHQTDNDAIHNMMEVMKSMAIEIPWPMKKSMALHHAKNDNVALTKEWFTPELAARLRADDRPHRKERTEVLQGILEFALRNNEMQWAQEMLDAASKASVEDENQLWQASIQAAVATGKTVDEVDKMIEVVVKRSKDQGRNAMPSIDLFNDLIEFSCAHLQPYMAERYFSLLQKWGAKPNARTYILQIKYRLAAQDYGGAQNAYAALREQPIVEHEDWDVMNEMICVLTAVPSIPQSVIVGLAEDISDRKRLFPAETVRALCSYHIKRDEYFEVVDLLQTYAYQYSIEQRTSIRNLLIAIALDPKTDTARSWDTYMIFHQVFDVETKRHARQQLMEEMFKRHRPDLATHVFTRMSKHPRADTRPDRETYIAAFAGIAATKEAESLEVIHNLLKLDTDVEPNTRLLNSLMMAYTANGMAWRSLEFWNEISISEEGPTYESLSLAFQACEKVPFGDKHARKIWDRLIAADIEISRSLAASYIGALTGNQLLEEAMGFVGSMQESLGMEPDALVLGTFFNSAYGLDNQENIKDFIMEHYPHVWEELEGAGIQEDEEGMQRIQGIEIATSP